MRLTAFPKIIWKVLRVFSGKNAGICYMGDSYFDSRVTDPDAALKRFVSTANNGHHSIADHIRVEVLIEGASKMLAIVLNSLPKYKMLGKCSEGYFYGSKDALDRLI